MTTEVVNVRTYKGPCIYVGRKMPGRDGHPLGNPFKLTDSISREDCIEKYQRWLAYHDEKDELLADLAAEVKRTGLPLGCWCHPELCHAHVLAAEVDQILRRRRRLHRRRRDP